VIDQRRNHALEAQKDSELNGHKHNGKDDADDCRDQSDPIVKEIAGRENKDHRAKQSMGIACEASNVMVVISTPSLDAITVASIAQFRPVAGSRFSDEAQWARILTAMNININDIAIGEIDSRGR